MNIKKYNRKTRYGFEKRKKYRKYTRQNQEACEQNQIVLYGDSITEMFDVKLLYGCTKLKVYNRGISGDTSNRLYERLENNLLNITPKQVFILIGTNDFGRGADYEFVFENIKKTVLKIKNNIKDISIVLQCVYPINLSNPNIEKSRNENIIKLNEKLIDFSAKNNINLMDITNELKDKNGELDSNLSDDGLHPNKAGFEIVAKAISLRLINKI